MIGCPICSGSGYVMEKHDEDSMHKEECPCVSRSQKDNFEHMVESGHAEIQDAKARKQLGQSKVLDNTEQESKDAIYLAIILLAAEDKDFTSDDVRRMVGEEKLNNVNKNCLGALITKASRQGIIKGTGQFVKSTIPSAHRRHIQVWEGIHA